MHPCAVTLYKTTRHAHDDGYKSIVELTRDMSARKPPDVNELADAIYALDQVEKLADSLRKEAKKVRDHLDKIMCAVCVEQELSVVKTEHCAATPSLKMVAPLPSKSKDPEHYAQLMEFFGIKRELWDTPVGVASPVQLHYPGMVDFVSDQLVSGKPIPPGIDPNKTYPVFRVSVRKLKDVDA